MLVRFSRDCDTLPHRSLCTMPDAAPSTDTCQRVVQREWLVKAREEIETPERGGAGRS